MPIKKKFSKLIVKDASGNLVQLLPETQVDTSLDSTSNFPIANSAVASVLNSIEIPYYQEVTQQENGLMTSYDKIKLDNSIPIYKEDTYWLSADPYSSPTKAYFQSQYVVTDDDIQNDKLSHIEYITVGRTSGDITDNLPLYITITSSENSAEIPIYASYNDWYSHTICTVGKFYKLLNASGGRIPIYIKNSTTSYLLTADIYQGATTNAQGVPGLVPSASTSEINSFLKGDGTWSNTYAQGPFGTTVAMSNNAIDLSTGNVFTKTISANTTFTITGVPSGTVAVFTIILTNGGNYTVTWPSSVKWKDSTAPDLTTSGKDVLTFLTPDGGTTWYGTVSLSGVA